MAISILFFGATADIVGSRKLQIDISNGESAAAVFERVLQEHSALSNHTLRFSVNQKYATGTETLNDGDELAIFTAVSGG